MAATVQARKRIDDVKVMARVVVIDDHPIVRHGLVQLLGRDESLEVCGEAVNAADAISVVTRCKPDLVTFDLSLPGELSGLDLLTKIASLHAGMKVLVLSMLDESIYAESVLQCGAVGYVEKHRATEQLQLAVQEVLAGGIFVPPATRDRLLARAATSHRDAFTDPVLSLSPRELQVFELLGKGCSTEQTAAELALSPKTVYTHRQHIMEKLSVLSGSQLLVYAASWVNQKMNGSKVVAAVDGELC